MPIVAHISFAPAVGVSYFQIDRCISCGSRYIRYDPQKAAKLLDEMALNKYDSDGFRLRPDGKTLTLTIEAADAMDTNPKVLELIAHYWRQVGIKSQLKLQARQLFWERKDAGLFDVAVWTNGAKHEPLLDPRWYFPYNSVTSFQAVNYARWFASGGISGEKPKGDILLAMELFQKIENTLQQDKQIELFREIIELNEKNLWVIGLVADVPAIMLVNNDFRNVPEVSILGISFGSPANTAPECYSIVGRQKQ
jgi:ABC-type transport system substrate-binding protein